MFRRFLSKTVGRAHNSKYSKTDLYIIKADLMKTLWTFERSESIHPLNAAKPRTSLTKFEGDSIQHSMKWMFRCRILIQFNIQHSIQHPSYDVHCVNFMIKLHVWLRYLTSLINYVTSLLNLITKLVSYWVFVYLTKLVN